MIPLYPHYPDPAAPVADPVGALAAAVLSPAVLDRIGRIAPRGVAAGATLLP